MPALWLLLLVLVVVPLPVSAQLPCTPTVVDRPAVTLAWTPPAVATGVTLTSYTLDQQDEEGVWTTIATLPGTDSRTTLRRLEVGTYAWRLLAEATYQGTIYHSGYALPGTPGPCATVTPVPVQTPAPVAAVPEQDMILLTWTPGSLDQEVRIQWRLPTDEGGKWKVLDVDFYNKTRDRAAKAGEQRCYRFSYETGVKHWTDEVCTAALGSAKMKGVPPLQPTPPAPVMVPAVAGQPTQIGLAWDAPATGPPGGEYRLYRRDASCLLSETPPQWLPSSRLKVVGVSNDDPVGWGAALAVDGKPGTLWHTAWRTTAVPPPHWIVLDLGQEETLSGFRYLPRQDGDPYGTIHAYEFFVSADGTHWGPPVSTGTLIATQAGTLERVKEQVRTFPAVRGRYVKLVALADNDIVRQPYTSAAELGVQVGASVPWQPIASVPPTQRLYVDAVDTFPACWYVTAVAATGAESVPSNTVEVAAAPPLVLPPPTAFRLVLE